MCCPFHSFLFELQFKDLCSGGHNVTSGNTEQIDEYSWWSRSWNGWNGQLLKHNITLIGNGRHDSLTNATLSGREKSVLSYEIVKEENKLIVPPTDTYL